jgi:hypothetical protein
MCLLVAWHAIVASFWERMYSRYLDKIMVTIVELLQALLFQKNFNLNLK